MNLSELIEKLGNDKVTFQLLTSSIDGNVQLTKNGTRYSFLSQVPMEDVILSEKKDALIVWVDRADMRRILAEARAAQEGGES